MGRKREGRAGVAARDLVDEVAGADEEGVEEEELAEEEEDLGEDDGGGGDGGGGGVGGADGEGDGGGCSSMGDTLVTCCRISRAMMLTEKSNAHHLQGSVVEGVAMAVKRSAGQ